MLNFVSSRLSLILKQMLLKIMHNIILNSFAFGDDLKKKRPFLIMPAYGIHFKKKGTTSTSFTTSSH